MRTVIRAVGMSVVSALIALLLLEGVTRYTYTRRLDYQIEMSRYASLMKRSADNPGMSHQHVPNSDAVLMGVPVNINSRGFRDREYPVRKPAGTFRIMLLGDSLTFGWGVKEEDRFSNRLERLLREQCATAFEVINTGIGNYNTEQEVTSFKELGQDFDPDIVLLGYFINDAEPVPTKTSPVILKYSYLAMWLWGRVDVLQRLYGDSPTYIDYYAALYEDGNPGWEASQSALRELDALASDADFQWSVAILPELHEVGPVYGFADAHEKIAAASQEAGADATLDLAPHFSSETDPSSLWVSADDAHPNAKAHGIIANGLYDFLNESDMLPPGSCR